MTKTEERVRQIGATILEQAGQESQAIRQAADREREAALTRYRDEVIDGMYGKIQAEIAAIKKECAAHRAAARREAHGSLLRRRGELEEQVFAAALAALARYADTPAYREALLERVQALAAAYDHRHSTVTLRPRDEDLAPRVKELLPGCVVESDPALEPGGFTLRNTAAGVLVSHTLKAALEGERQWFLRHAELHVTEQRA